MLCPEVWKFTPRNSYNKETGGQIQETQFPPPLKTFYFSHLVSVVLPTNENIDSVIKSFSEDFEYYKVNDFSLSDLCSKNFVDNFIRKGSVTVLSINTRIDVDNCFCITPEGELVLSLNKKSYQELGLEGKPSTFCGSRKDRYIIKLNLKNENFTVQKRRHQRIKECLKLRLHKFNIILNWEPPEENICPSSIAKFLFELGYNVEVCQPKFKIRSKNNVKIPLLTKNSTDEIIEWLGMFSLDADIDSGSYDCYQNTYECPEINILVKTEIKYIEWRGLFTVHQLQRLYETIIKYLPNFQITPWSSIYVQGFSDSPISWKLEEHTFFGNGDNAYVLLIEPSGQYILYTHNSSRKKLIQ